MRVPTTAARTVIATITVSLALGCGASSASQAPSGLTGRVLIGPTCPVQRAGERCVQPYRAQIVVFRSRDRHRVTSFRSGAEGRFRIDLAPGRYMLAAAKPGLPRLTPVYATVHAGRFTNLTLVFDTGIR